MLVNYDFKQKIIIKKYKMSVSFLIDSFVKKKIEYFRNKNNCNIIILIGKYKNGFQHWIEPDYCKKLKDCILADPIKSGYVKSFDSQIIDYKILDSIDLDLSEYNLKIQLVTKNNMFCPYNIIFEGDFKISLLFNNMQNQTNPSSLEDILKYILTPISKGKYLCCYQERKSVVQNFNNLLGKNSKNPFIVFNKPYNLKREGLNSLDNYLIFPKLDGIRYFLYINRGVYLINSTEFLKINNDADVENTLIDGEFIDGVYYPFDVLFWNNEDIRQKNRLNRLDYLKRLGEIKNINISIINPEENLYNGYLKFKEMKNTDGVILSPNLEPYNNTKTYKYKPDELQVIDFSVRREVETGYGMYGLYVKDDKNNYVQFKGGDKYPFSGYTRLNTEERKIVDNNIDRVIEFKWKYDRFIPLRVRTDKTQANYINVALSIWEDINDPISEKEFLDKTKLKNLPETIEINLMNNYSAKILEPNDTYTFFSPFYPDLIRTGVLGDGSCFFHALFYSLSKDYRKMGLMDKNKFVKNFRRDLSRTISVNDWLSFGGGSIALIAYQSRINKTFERLYDYFCFDKEINSDYKKIIKNNLKIKKILDKNNKKYYLDKFLPDFFKNHPGIINSKDELGDEMNLRDFMYDICEFSKEYEYQSFIEYVDSDGWVDQSLIGYISDVVDRDIYFIDGDTRVPYMIGGKADYKRRKSVVLCFTNSSHFESMGVIRNGKVSREFNGDDKLIEKIYSFLFKKEIFRKTYPELKMYLPSHFQ